MTLSCVLTRCANCGDEVYRSAGGFARLSGLPLTVHTAATIPSVMTCDECGSSQLDVLFANDKRPIVRAGRTPHCRFCENYIPERFVANFPLADFCPLCAALGQVADSDVVKAYGRLVPEYGDSLDGEAYRFLSLEFWMARDHASEMKWLRKAAAEGDSAANQKLGDHLCRSNDPTDLANAAIAYEVAAKGSARSPGDGYAERRLAEMLFHGRGQPADPERAVELMLRAADKGNSVAASDLGGLYFNGACGLRRDPARAFENYQKAYEMSGKHINMACSAALGLMLLEGVGTTADETKGTLPLMRSIALFSEGAMRSKFDREACFREIAAARKLKDGEVADLPVARLYLDRMSRLRVPLAGDLLARCGGALPPHQRRWELSLSSVLPDDAKGELWRVSSPEGDRVGQGGVLGQVERLPDRRWIATTDTGAVVGETFSSRKEAVEALAFALNCDAPYVASAFEKFY